MGPGPGVGATGRRGRLSLRAAAGEWRREPSHDQGGQGPDARRRRRRAAPEDDDGHDVEDELVPLAAHHEPPVPRTGVGPPVLGVVVVVVLCGPPRAPPVSRRGLRRRRRRRPSTVEGSSAYALSGTGRESGGAEIGCRPSTWHRSPALFPSS